MDSGPADVTGDPSTSMDTAVDLDEDCDLWGGSTDDDDGEPSPASATPKRLHSRFHALKMRIEQNLLATTKALEEMTATFAPTAQGSFAVADAITSQQQDFNRRQDDAESQRSMKLQRHWTSSMERKLSEQLVMRRNFERLLHRLDNEDGEASRTSRPMAHLRQNMLLLPRPSGASCGLVMPDDRRELISGRFTAGLTRHITDHQRGFLTASLVLHKSSYKARPPDVPPIGCTLYALLLDRHCTLVQWGLDLTKLTAPDSQANEEIRAMAERIAEEVEEQSGLLKEELLSSPWALLAAAKRDAASLDIESEPQTMTLLWPTMLCVAKQITERGDGRAPPGSANKQALSQSTLSKMPGPDLLEFSSVLVSDLQRREADAANSDQDGASDVHALIGDPITTKEVEEQAKPQKPASPVHHGASTGRAEQSRTSETHATPNPIDEDESGDADDADDDDDLFGSDDEETTGDLGMRQVDHAERSPATSGHRDEEMYGMVTEDDFAFFDDAMQAGFIGGLDTDGYQQQLPSPVKAAPLDNQTDIDMDGIRAPLFGERDGDHLKSTAHAAPSVPFAVPTPAYSSSAGTSGIPTDPASLPAFTPGSFTDSSPATGGPLDRTPRTPTSPYYDPGHSVARHGKAWDAPDGAARMDILSDNGRAETLHGSASLHSDATMRDDDMIVDYNDLTVVDENSIKGSHTTGDDRNRRLRDLGEKYGTGKFALPENLAVGIAGGGRRLGGKRAGLQSSEANGPKDATRMILSSSQKLHRTARDEGSGPLSDAGTMDDTIGMGQGEDDADDEDDDDDDDDDEDDEEDDSAITDQEPDNDGSSEALEQVMEAIKATLHVTTQSWTAATDAKAPPAGADRDVAAFLEDFGVNAAEDDDVTHTFRDAWIERLLTNLPMRRLAHRRLGTPVQPTIIAPYELSDILSAVESLAGPQSTVGQLTGEGEAAIQVLETPRIRLGLQGGIAEMHPSALRFWNKLGLSPAGGPRHVAVCLLCLSHQTKAWIDEAERWLQALGHAYESLGLGSCPTLESIVLDVGEVENLGQACMQLLASVEQNEDTLHSIFTRVKSSLGPDRHVAIYAVGEPAATSSFDAFVKIEAGLRGIAKDRLGEFGNHVNVMGTPWSSISGNRQELGDGEVSHTSTSLKSQSLLLYSSLSTTVQHTPLKHLHPSIKIRSASFRPPVYTIVPPTRQGSSDDAVSFRLNTNLVNEEATCKQTLLHVAYDAGPKPDDLACVSIVDESAQALKVKSRRRGECLESMLRWVWSEVVHFMDQAPFRWRVVLSKMRPTSAQEVETWSEIAREAMVRCKCVDVILACRDAHPSLLAEVAPPDLDPPTRPGYGPQMMQDIGHGHFALYPCLQLAIGPQEEGSPPVIALRSAVSISTQRGAYGAKIGTDMAQSDTPHRHDCGAETTDVAYLHMLAIYPGRLSQNAAAPTVAAAGSMTPLAVDAESAKYVDAVDCDALIRQITDSQHALRIVSREPYWFDETGAKPCHFAALDSLWPCMRLFAVRPPPAVTPSSSRRSSSSGGDDDGNDDDGDGDDDDEGDQVVEMETSSDVHSFSNRKRVRKEEAS